MTISRILMSTLLVSGLIMVCAVQAAPRQAAQATTASVTQPIDINTASAATLETLKGIGPKKAEAIVQYRRQNGSFGTLQDLTKVKGIGSAFLARLEKRNPGRLVVKSHG